jgi:bifunctional UDP-N-acetylglucosamine pyrophosphorylase/glucosamine-1-phosphate N-acetyltransferase
MPSDLNVVVLAAGEGTRLPGSRPKVLTPLWGRPAVRFPVEAALGLQPERLVVVAGRHFDAVREALAGSPVEFAHQERPEGTGAAVLAAQEFLTDRSGPMLILYGDCPLVDTELLADLVQTHRDERAALTVLTTQLPDPRGYGRIVRDADGRLSSIVEEVDADPATRARTEVNTGVWVVELPRALQDLREVGRANAKSEVYLTDLVGVALKAGQKVATVPCEDPSLVMGFNDHRELAAVRGVLHWRILGRHLSAGVEIVDPPTTFIDADVTIEAGARILPCTVIEGVTHVAGGCEVGPFAHLRTGSVLEEGAEVGNFTETKKAVLGPGSKAKHLSYLGDVTVGARANIGAGTITANYDGRAKHATRVGEGAFIGSGTVLVAPVTVEKDATTGAGAVVTRNSVVGEGQTWVGVPARPLDRSDRET